MTTEKEKKTQLGKYKRHLPLFKTNLQRVLDKAKGFKQLAFSQDISESEINENKTEAAQILQSLNRNTRNLQELLTNASAAAEETDSETILTEDQLIQAEQMICDAEDIQDLIQVYNESLFDYQKTLRESREQEKQEKTRERLEEKKLCLEHETALEKLRLESCSGSLRSRQSSIQSLPVEAEEPGVDEVVASPIAVKEIPASRDQPSEDASSQESVVKELKEAMNQLTHIVMEKLQATPQVPGTQTIFAPAESTSMQQFESPLNHTVGSFQLPHAFPSTAPSIKLPKLHLQPFDGTLTKWNAFWGLFKSSVHNSALSPIEKLNYLLSYLRGEAKAAIDGLSITNENYEAAVSILQERFGKQTAIINSLFSQLENLKLQGNSTRQLRNFTNELETILRQIAASGEATESQHLTSHILKKLPGDLRLKLRTNLREPVQWSVQLIRSALKVYLEALEEVEEDERNQRQGRPVKESKPWNCEVQQKSFSRLLTPTGEALATGARWNNEAKEQRTQRQQPISQCIFCKNVGHYHDDCLKFSENTQRKKILSNESRCYNCLKQGHGLKDCQRNRPCFHCKRKGHNSSICFQREKQSMSTRQTPMNQKKAEYRKQNYTTSNSVTEPTSEQIVEPGETSTNLLNMSETVLMQTAQAVIENPANHRRYLVKILFDSGSQRSYIQTKVARSLELNRIATQSLTLNTFGNTMGRILHLPLVEFAMLFKDGSAMMVQANEKPQITGRIHRAAVPNELIQFPTHLLADVPPTKADDFEIQLLIGLDYLQDIVSSERNMIVPGFYATQSRLGLILAGRVEKFPEGPYANTLTCHVNSDELFEVEPKLAIEDLGCLERIGIYDEARTTDDDLAVKSFEDTVKFCSGRYAVTWPWKLEMKPDSGPTNYGLAMGRLKSTLNRLSKDKDTLAKYNAILQEQLEKEIIEVAPPADSSSHYLPHHPVVTPSKATTKVRIVYDASAKPSKAKYSLNDCLYRGPVMLKDLAGLLLRFRMYPIVLLSDIEKAFLQVELQPSERNVCRFLWLKDPTNISTNSSNLQHFQFRRVPFGVISSPFLLAATVSHHLKKVGTSAALSILESIYVDNVIVGTKTTEKAIEFYIEAKQMFAEASMNLREWCSNSKEFMKSIPEKDQVKGDEQKVLGVNWNTETDCLSFSSQKPNKKPQKCTKRTVLKSIASIFDPLGLISFATFKAKVFLQRLWMEEFEWDRNLSDELCQEWNEIEKQLQEISTVKIPRFVGSGDEKVKPLLVCFTDASVHGYAALVYLKLQTNVNLIFAKARVAPKKVLTIPRLELMGVWVGTKVIQFVENQLKVKFEKKVLFTDSQCVLQWLKCEELHQVFVANRVSDINKISNELEFKYVSTKENPADIATRGLAVCMVKDSIWWHGPKWLAQDIDDWPSGELPTLTKEMKEIVKSEMKTSKVQEEMLVASENVDLSEYKTFLQRFPSLQKLIRVVALCLRVKSKKTGPILSDEFKIARNRLIKWCQKVQFQDTLKAIRQGKTNELVKQFGLKMHDDGLLHCYGRFGNSHLMPHTMNPILLAKNDSLTELVIQEAHSNLFHAGAEHTLAHLRQWYWIPQGRRQVQKILQRCQICRRHEGGPYRAPKLSPWPQKRVVRSTPFTHTGLDYCGPLYIKEDKASHKVWICLFTCMASRAIHLDVVENMTTEAFLQCLTRFISLRGCPIEITCDNASTFKAAKDILENMWKQAIHDPDTISYCSERGIKWSFIVELAPWMGGVYERLIGLIKRVLRKALGRKSLNFVQFQTLLYQISAIVNSRPLTYVGNFPSGQPLTPADLLNPGSRLGIPALGLEQADPDYLSKSTTKDDLYQAWQGRLRILEDFWKRWESEYLLSLRERSQVELKQTRIRAKEMPQLNDIVLIKENFLPRGRWKMGKIIELISSEDGEVRSASVLLPNKKLLHRSVTHLYPLEIRPDSTTATKFNDKETDIVEAKIDMIASEPVTLKRNTLRKAAMKANQIIKQYYENDEQDNIWNE